MPKHHHTPAPWESGVATLKVGVPAGVEQFAVCAQDNPRRIIAVTGTVGAPDEAESIANAILLAAAPDLLQSAKNALADLEGILPEFEPSGDREHPAWQTINELKAAIAKAESEA